MKKIKVGNLELSDAAPKVCIPIVGENHDGVLEQARQIVTMEPDLIEWRCDFFDSMYIDEIENMLIDLKEITKDIPLIFTFRTESEGGNKFISNKSYYDLNVEVAKTGLAELIDVEAYSKDGIALEMIEEIHKAGAKVIGSNHHFNETPSKEEMVETLMTMEELGADICKLAVMPKNREDVLRLVQSSKEANEKMLVPIITMSMSEMGAVTRVGCKSTGSVVTFAAGIDASAPGQISCKKVKEMLNVNVCKDYNIFMIGFMGTGKTTISNALGMITGLPVIDVDQYIQQKEQMTIVEIFEKYGEDYFREKETEALEELQKKSGRIISCGGGVVLKNKNISVMKEKGKIVLLTATAETVYDRVKQNKDRPLLKDDMSVTHIENMLNERRDKYLKAAQIVIETDNKTRIDICRDILLALKEQ